MCTRCTLPTRYSIRFSHHSRKSSRHPPPPNSHIHRNVPRKGVECDRFRRWVSTGSSADLSPDFCVGRRLPIPNRQLSGRPPFPFLGSARSPSSVTRRDSFVCMVVTRPLDRPYACLSHTSFSDSRVSPPPRCPRTQHVASSKDHLSPARLARTSSGMSFLPFLTRSLSFSVTSCMLILVPSSPRSSLP